MSDCLFLWKQKEGQPHKLGGIEKAVADIEFDEAKIYHDENKAILYGYGISNNTIWRPNPKIKKYEQYDYEQRELIQISLPLQDFKEGDYQKKATDFTRIVGKYLIHNFADKCFTIMLKLNSVNEGNLLKLENNLDWTVDEDPGAFILPYIIPTWTECTEDKLKDFTLDTSVITYTKKGSTNYHNELNKLNDRWEFLKSLLYEKGFDHKDFDVATVAKAYNTLDVEAKEIISLLMGR